MTDVPVAHSAAHPAAHPHTSEIDLRAEIARIDRDRAETQKLEVEGRKMEAERRKLEAEQLKLYAEGAKFNRDRWMMPLVAVVPALLGIIVGYLLKIGS